MACHIHGVSHPDTWTIHAMLWRDTWSCLGSCSVQHKAPKSQWLSCLIFFYRLVGIAAYTRMASEGGTYRKVCIQLVSRMWIPGILRVGKVGVSISLKWPSSKELMLQDLGCLALWVWVQDKSRPRHGLTSKVSLSVLHYNAKSTFPSHMPTEQDTNLCSNNGQG